MVYLPPLVAAAAKTAVGEARRQQPHRSAGGQNKLTILQRTRGHSTGALTGDPRVAVSDRSLPIWDVLCAKQMLSLAERIEETGGPRSTFTFGSSV